MSKGITLTVAEQEKLARLGDITGKIAKAKEDLDKAQCKPEPKEPGAPEPPKKSENDIQWENLIKHLNRSVNPSTPWDALLLSLPISLGLIEGLQLRVAYGSNWNESCSIWLIIDSYL